jgi:hypothetical protein
LDVDVAVPVVLGVLAIMLDWVSMNALPLAFRTLVERV